MSWERQKSTVSPMPEEPPLLLWLVIGLVALITGVLLFVLHVNGLAGPLQQFNLWCVAACLWWSGLCSSVCGDGDTIACVKSTSLKGMKLNMLNSSGLHGPEEILLCYTAPLYFLMHSRHAFSCKLLLSWSCTPFRRAVCLCLRGAIYFLSFSQA